MGWQDAAAGFSEIPRGMTARKIWMDPAVFPLIAACGFASLLVGGMITKHFTGNTDVALDKKVRQDPNHQGGTERRMLRHNHHFGMYNINKHRIDIFPFNYVPFHEIIDKHRND